MWYVLAGEQAMPIVADEREFAGVRWVDIDDVDAWVTDCYAPQQVARFFSKLTATLRRAQVQV